VSQANTALRSEPGLVDQTPVGANGSETFRARKIEILSAPSALSAVTFFIVLHEELTQDIIGSAMTVLNELKPGLDEKLYENALVIELRARGHSVEQQLEYPGHYRGEFIVRLIPDLIVDRTVIADPKVVTAFNDSHIAQMLGYLNITGLQVALLLNFKESKLDWKRVGNELKRRTADFADRTDKKASY
jgi:GxxExxY protein